MKTTDIHSVLNFVDISFNFPIYDLALTLVIFRQFLLIFWISFTS